MKFIHLALAFLCAVAPAAAQTRTLVVPGNVSVAVPARGAPPGVSLMAARAPRAGRPADATALGPVRDTSTWERIKPLWPLIPLGIAAAVVAATLPGGGGGGAGAPAATR